MAQTIHVFKRTLDGSAPVTEYIPIYQSTTVTKGYAYQMSSGYLLVAADGGYFPVGVAEATVDNSTGAHGAKSAPVQVNKQAVYEGTLDTSSSATYYGIACDVGDDGKTIDVGDTTNTKGIPFLLLGPVGTATDKRQEWIFNPAATQQAQS